MILSRKNIQAMSLTTEATASHKKDIPIFRVLADYPEDSGNTHRVSDGCLCYLGNTVCDRTGLRSTYHINLKSFISSDYKWPDTAFHILY